MKTNIERLIYLCLVDTCMGLDPFDSDVPTRPHDAECGQVIGDNSPDIVRKMKGPVRKTVAREERCGCDAHYTLQIGPNLGLAVCATHHPEKVGPDY